ncbi:MAG: DUF302 domain-containing protein [Bacteroidales bacterium]
MEKSKFYFEKKLSSNFEEAVEKVTVELKKYGFGVLTEINLHEKFKEKLGKDFRKYRILGACNPGFAYKAIQIEDKVGTLLPCSVIIQEIAPEVTEVAVIDPYASMKGIGSEKLLELASEAGEELKKAVDNL